MFIGILYLFLTFVICFILVHLIKLAHMGLKSTKKKPEPPPEKKPEPKPEPVYYIVEKKRSKKASYSEPKEIKFKK
ncbi:MAG: hypothetical protein K2I30_04360 [Clostridia bacterium]|nr:hypothetical protein [Clostridia bacterium]